MSDAWLTIGVPAAVAVATGVYTTGGRATLARRTIRQELELAALLPDGHGREAVEQMAEEKAVLYASRWIGPQPLRLREHAFFVGMALLGSFMAWLAARLSTHAENRPWISTYLLVWMLSGLAATAVGLTAWVSLVFMADNARTRAESIEKRRERVKKHLAVRAKSERSRRNG